MGMPNELPMHAPPRASGSPWVLSNEIGAADFVGKLLEPVSHLPRSIFVNFTPIPH